MINPLARSPSETITFDEGDFVILCEGLEDCALLKSLTDNWGRRPKIGTKAQDPGLTWEKEIHDLAYQVQMRKLGAVIFVFDAEESRTKQFAELRRMCRAAKLPLPKAISKVEWKLVRGVRTRVGLHFNPHGRRSGSIESLFIPQIEQQEQDWRCIKNLLRCYKNKGTALVGAKREKVILRTFIAERRPHNTGIAVALSDGILHCNGPEFAGIREFLEAARALS